MYEFEYMLDDVKEIQTQEQEEQERQQEEYQGMNKMPNMNSMMNQAKSNFSMPKMSMPKF